MYTCSNCGVKNQDVISRLAYVGGECYIQIFQCRDEVACWKRWDEQHGLSGLTLENGGEYQCTKNQQ